MALSENPKVKRSANILSAAYTEQMLIFYVEPYSFPIQCADYTICKSRADYKHEFALLKGNFVLFEEGMTNPVSVGCVTV